MKLVISSIGQADDVVLLSNSPLNIRCLLYLTETYCKRYNVDLVPEKTKLLVWSPRTKSHLTEILKLECPILINNKTIEYSSSAEHVGVIGSFDGCNMPHVLERTAAYRKAMGSILHTGLARNHKANPKSTLHLERMYGSPVLLSGVASLLLSSKEIGVIFQQQKKTIRSLQKLPTNTPDCVIFFLAGRLPSTALIHLRQLSLLGMLARQGSESVLSKIGTFALTSNKSTRSWFSKIHSICTQYSLPDPILIIEAPPTKLTWKNMCKSRVISFWERKLRQEASALPSLAYFKPSFMSLCTSHPLWTFADSL